MNTPTRATLLQYLDTEQVPVRKNGGFWTAARTETLLTFWASKSAGEIASYFGVTRNTVVGKLRRLGALGGISKEERYKRCSRATRKYYERSPDARVAASQRLRALWTDPKWRAETLAARAATQRAISKVSA